MNIYIDIYIYLIFRLVQAKIFVCDDAEKFINCTNNIITWFYFTSLLINTHYKCV